MDTAAARAEHESELSSRPETSLWTALRRVQSALSNGFVHRWAARRVDHGEAVLDAGCGDGRFHRVWGGGSYLGLEFVERLARRAHDLSAVPAVCLADIGQAPVGAATFDVVVCFEVLEHVDAPQATIQEFARVLRPGGRLLVSVPNDDGLKHRLKKDPHPLHAEDHMDEERLLSLFDPNFRVLAFERRGVWLFTPGRFSLQFGMRARRSIATNLLVEAIRLES